MKTLLLLSALCASLAGSTARGSDSLFQLFPVAEADAAGDARIGGAEFALFPAPAVAELPQVKPAAEPAPDSRPVVIGWKPDFPCAACNLVRAHAEELPFQIAWRQDDEHRCAAYPTFELTARGNTYRYVGANVPLLADWFRRLTAPQMLSHHARR